MSDAEPRRFPWVLFGLLAVAAILRGWGLSSFPWEQDELYTLRDSAGLNLEAGMSGPGIAARPLYYFLQHLLLAVTPSTPFWLRVLPFVFGLAGIAVTWMLARRLFGSLAAFVAALLVTFSPWHLYVSGMARYWTLVYVLSAEAILLLIRAFDTDRARDYVAAMVVLLLGAFTHPSFVFAAAGYCAALFVVDAAGRYAFTMQTRRAWVALWGPLVGLGVVITLALRRLSHGGGLRNWGGRGLEATLRIAPAMVEWMTLPVAAAALASVILLLVKPGVANRRFGTMTVAGCLASVILVTIAGMYTSTYADYGVAMLPLVYVSLAGGVALVAEALAPQARVAWTASAATVLVAATLPGVVSNLTDGMRFDFRPAYGYIAEFGADRPVVGGPVAIQRVYGPGLHHTEFPANGVIGLERTLRQTHGFWLLLPYARFGMLDDNGWSRRWVDLRCQTVLRTERQRLDYRVYRLDLAWCGTDRPPGPLGRLPFDAVPADSSTTPSR